MKLIKTKQYGINIINYSGSGYNTYLILLSGWGGSLYFDNSEVLIQSFIYAGIVMGIKAGASEFRKHKQDK